MVELLSPVGNFECLKAAVQNGANAVYFGSNSFNARAFANNFGIDTLEQAINYAKLRGVKTHLTLNTLIKDNEFEDAFNLAKKAYEYGIDAIIIQDLGLASELLKYFPNITLHGSTQMTVHNLDGVKKLEKLGFKRVILSRELSINEIEYICKNSNIEVEVFVHGALCISYSGQCLLSSMIGGRSGNRGKCAQPCRLPYKLLDDETEIDSGYLLSPRDLCGLELLPRLINTGVTSLKIEGRMKSPEYVATVTKIYRKYIDIILNTKPFAIDVNDKKDLMQVFNRGGFSKGHLEDSPNTNLVFKQKPNNMGIYIGKVEKYNSIKGLISCTLKETVEIGDEICFDKENSKYTISELMNKNENIKESDMNQTVTFGRMKGNINIGDKIYKISSKTLTKNALDSFAKENIKIPISCNINIKANKPITIEVFSKNHNLSTKFTYDYIPLTADNKPLSKDKIIAQFDKTIDTPYKFTQINIDLDNNLFLPVSVLNDLRRNAIKNIEEVILDSFKKVVNFDAPEKMHINNTKIKAIQKKEISLLLNKLNMNYDYSKLRNIDRVYIPLKYFYNNHLEVILNKISNNFNTYIYLPPIIKEKHIKTVKKSIAEVISNYSIKGFNISNISQFDILKDFNNLEIISNYTLNCFNYYTMKSLKNMGTQIITVSPELDKQPIVNLCNSDIKSELIVYGNLPLMTSNYCLLGNSNKCHNTCKKSCLNENKKYFLKDRFGITFKIIPDNTQTITTIYNSKTLSIPANDFNSDSVRIDILDESIDEVNDIIDVVASGNRLAGKKYTNGNLNRII